MWKCSLILLTLCLGEHQAEARRYHGQSRHTFENHYRHRIRDVQPVCADGLRRPQWPAVGREIEWVGASGFWVHDYKQALDETWLHLK